MLTITERAKQQALKIMQEENKQGYFIRVAVKPGGCSGLSYLLEFDNQINPTDKVFETNEVSIVCETKSFLYLVGTTLDYEGGLKGKGFNFINPNANKTCGCGESFAL